MEKPKGGGIGKREGGEKIRGNIKKTEKRKGRGGKKSENKRKSNRTESRGRER